MTRRELLLAILEKLEQDFTNMKCETYYKLEENFAKQRRCLRLLQELDRRSEQ